MPALPPGAETTGQMNQVGADQAGAAGAGNLPARQDGPVEIPSSPASGAVPAVAPIPRAFPLIPEPEVDGDGGGAGGHNYVVGGNVLGIVLGIITVVALVWALVIALRTDNSQEALAAKAAANRSANGGEDNSGALDTDTSAGGSSTGTAAGDSTAAGAGTTGTDTAAGASGDAAAGGGGGGGGAAAGGAFKLAPATGTYAVTGTGFRKNTPPGNSTSVSSPSLQVSGAGSGCYNFKFTIDPGNWNQATMCGTTDGGLVLTKNVQYIKTVIVGNLAEENTDTMNCSPPDVNLPANPAPGVSGTGGGTCIGTNSSDKAPGKNKQTSKYTVVGKETIAGVECWHVSRAVALEPADTVNTQKGPIAEDYWWSASNGLLMRWKQNTNVTSTVAGVLSVVYVQQLDLTLSSPNPS